MKLLKNVARLVTIFVPGRERRKRARLKLEKILHALLRTEYYRCSKWWEAIAAFNASLPREKFHIISLGTNCFARMTLNLWKLKPRKAEGELTMPFDLAVHPLSVVVDNLKNNFNSYFEYIEFSDEKGFFSNRAKGVNFVHDKENDFHLFEERYQRRIADLKAAMTDDKPCLFVCHLLGDVRGEEADELYNVLQISCGHKKFKLLLAVFNGSVGKCNENIKVYTAKFPYEGYSYMDKNVKFTQAGYDFEEKFVLCCRGELLKLLEDENA